MGNSVESVRQLPPPTITKVHECGKGKEEKISLWVSQHSALRIDIVVEMAAAVYGIVQCTVQYLAGVSGFSAAGVMS